MQIKPYPQNAKKHPQKQIDQIAASIKEFGMNQPIVVDKDGYIIVGHGRWLACQQLGIEPEYKVVNLTEDQAKAYRLADNRLNESIWDMDMVIDELRSLPSAMAGLTGFDRELGQFEPATLDEQGKLDEKTPTKCPECGHEWTK